MDRKLDNKAFILKCLRLIQAAIRTGFENRAVYQNTSAGVRGFPPGERTKADSSLTTPELKSVRGPVHSE
jgi:hypothetical protein